MAPCQMPTKAWTTSAFHPSAGWEVSTLFRGRGRSRKSSDEDRGKARPVRADLGSQAGNSSGRKIAAPIINLQRRGIIGGKNTVDETVNFLLMAVEEHFITKVQGGAAVSNANPCRCSAPVQGQKEHSGRRFQDWQHRRIRSGHTG